MTDTELITASEVVHAETERKSLVAKFAGKYGLEPNRMMATLKATAFRGDVSNEQMAALLIVADQHGLNPWTKEIYAFPSRNGIVPVVGVDGWARIINEHPQFDGMDFKQDDEKCTCKMYRKDRKHPTVVTEYAKECYRPTDPWNSHPKRMLRHKAMIQCARLAFAFAGIYDPDEAERVLAAEDAIDVTPVKMSPKRIKELAEGMLEAVKAENGVKLHELYDPLSNDERLALWPHLRSYERSGIKKLLSHTQTLPEGMDLVSWSLEAISTAKAPDELQASWRAIQDAFAEADTEVTPEVLEAYDDRRLVLGVPEGGGE